LSNGQETIMQIMLIGDGVTGHYVPRARAWHYVPATRSSASWALKRAFREGYLQGTLPENTGAKRETILKYLFCKFVRIVKLPGSLFTRLASDPFDFPFSVVKKIGALYSHLSRDRFDAARTIKEEAVKEIEIRQFPEHLPGDLWGITTFFNPVGYSNKLQNFKVFRQAIKEQGLKLLAVELAFGDRPFELNTSDAEILIQLRTGEENILWQKERLLNIGLKNLPDQCDKIAWLDADMIFQNSNWVKETSILLESYAFVQPYSFVVRLPKGMLDGTSLDDKIPLGQGELHKMHGIAYGMATSSKACLGSYVEHGETGYAWAARRKILEECGGFIDGLICGSGDLMMARAFYDIVPHFGEKLPSDRLFSRFAWWCATAFKKHKGSVFYTDGLVLHLWHGSLSNRQYETRHEILARHRFDEQNDIKLGNNGVWEWASDKKDLHAEVKKYFASRYENGNQNPRAAETLIHYWASGKARFHNLKKQLLCSFSPFREQAQDRPGDKS
jgi:hypothetical protein